jgi:hypothetical protein
MLWNFLNSDNNSNNRKEMMSAGDITHQVDPEKMNNINVYKYKTDLE